MLNKYLAKQSGSQNIYETEFLTVEKRFSFVIFLGEIHVGLAGVALDSVVSSDGSSSGSGSSLDSSHVLGDGFHVLLLSVGGCLGSSSGFETSSLASLDGGSVCLGPFDVVFTSCGSSLDGSIL